MAHAQWPDPPFHAVWSRGHGCRELANALDGGAQRVDGNTEAACVEERASLLVSRRMSTRFDLVSMAVPHELELEAAEAIVALVGGGPNSRLAANVTVRVGRSLGIPTRMLCAYRTEGEQAGALTTVEQVFALEPSLEFRTVQADSASEIVESLGPHEVAVLGAPAGWWLQRQIFGTGARLLANVPAGAVVVKDAPTRAFQMMDEPVGVGPLMAVRDARLLFSERRLAVVDENRFLGMVSQSSLAEAEPSALVGDLMDEVEALRQTDPLPDVSSSADLPIPVVDGNGRLMGILTAPD